MYIEVIHDSEGEVVACYCADTLPSTDGEPLFKVKGMKDSEGVFHHGLPPGLEQARVNIDTAVAMEIESSGVERNDYVAANFRVDTKREIPTPPGVRLPEGFTLRGIARKTH